MHLSNEVRKRSRLCSGLTLHEFSKTCFVRQKESTCGCRARRARADVRVCQSRAPPLYHFLHLYITAVCADVTSAMGSARKAASAPPCATGRSTQVPVPRSGSLWQPSLSETVRPARCLQRTKRWLPVTPLVHVFTSVLARRAVSSVGPQEGVISVACSSTLRAMAPPFVPAGGDAFRESARTVDAAVSVVRLPPALAAAPVLVASRLTQKATSALAPFRRPVVSGPPPMGGTPIVDAFRATTRASAFS